MTEEYKGYTIKIKQDEDAQSPSPRENDNLGTMVCFHGRHTLGDTDHGLQSGDFSGWNALKVYIEKELKGTIILPLYLYDHSGLRIKVGSFQGLLSQGHAEFDSGQVGFIYITSEKIRREYSKKRVSPKFKATVTGFLESEVKVYDQYLSGDVWGYVIEKDGKDAESCWGFYGQDFCLEEAKALIDNLEGE